MHPPGMKCRGTGEDKQNKNWINFGDVVNSVKSAEVCAEKCRVTDPSYKYFSLECPRASEVRCKCAKNLDGTTPKDESQCNKKNVQGSTLCVGPYVQGEYMLGGHQTGSVYLIEPGIFRIFRVNFIFRRWLVFRESAGLFYPRVYFSTLAGFPRVWLVFRESAGLFYFSTLAGFPRVRWLVFRESKNARAAGFWEKSKP